MRLERKVLRKEYECILREEACEVLLSLQTLLSDGANSLNFNFLPEHGFTFKPEKFLLSSQNASQQVKCMVTIVGDLIYEADLALKVQRQLLVPYQTRIYPDVPWKLQQLQDARNQVLKALSVIENLEGSFNFTSGLQVLNILEAISSNLQLGRECLTIPKRKSLEEIVKNPAVRAFKPALPQDMAVSFYIQEQRLIMAVYQLYTNQMNRVDISSRHQVECVVPWLNEMLLLFVTASQRCQELQDKVSLLMSCLGDTEPVSTFESSDQEFHRSNQTSLLIDLIPEKTDMDKRLQGGDTIQNNHVLSRTEVNWF